MLCAISSHKTTALPAFFPEDDQGRNYSLDGYPQQQALENYAYYLLITLQHSSALSSINLALWNQNFANQEQACSAVDTFLRERAEEDFPVETGRGCRETYRCDYDRYRFPSTLIAVECGSVDGSFCRKTENRPTRGVCLGDQYGLHTLKFIPDNPEPAAAAHQVIVSNDGASGNGESNHHEEGRWGFQRTATNKGCLCV